MKKNRLLLVTDFYYQANGREYFKEDLDLGYCLREYFHLTTTHIKDMDLDAEWMDIVLVRNTGPQATHMQELLDLKKDCKVPISNDLNGKGDILGKGHLLELYKAGYPVIPTVDSLQDLTFLFDDRENRYLLKPKNGCDSKGVLILTYDELMDQDIEGLIIQPLTSFEYEVSFYFIDSYFQYALYAPNPTARWILEPYVASKEDIEFARKFIDWNTCSTGIQRVDACRLLNGALALMELEDYNPYLSLDRLPQDQKDNFVEALCKSLLNQIDS